MKHLLRKMSSAELQELVDLVAGCTCSLNQPDKSKTGEKIVQTETKEYFDTIIFNFENITNSVKSYKQSIEEYVLEKDRDYAELQLELSSLRELESKEYAAEKASIEKLNKKIKDLSDLIKTKSAGNKPKDEPPTTPEVPLPNAPPPLIAKPPAPGKPPPLIAKPGAPGAASTAGKIAAGAGVLTAAGAVVTSAFNPARTLNGVTRPHEGTDIRARTPKPLYAIKAGKVIFAGSMKGYGNYVIIEHDDVRSAYAHLSHMSVKKGDIVKQGQQIGKSGDTTATDERVTPHLHFEIRQKDKGDKGLGTPIDPEKYLQENSGVNSPIKSSTATPTPTPSSSDVTDDQIEAAAKTIRTKESQGDYAIENKPMPGKKASSASGAYQFTDETWQTLTKKYKIGEQYSRARDAPPPIQDAVAKNRIREILIESKGDMSKVPVKWFTGNIEGISEVASPAEVAKYGSEWMEKFNSIYRPQKPEPKSNPKPMLTQTKPERLKKQEKTKTVILPIILGYK